MELGLHICDFTWDGGPPAIAEHLRDIAVTADDAGFTKLSVMDHVWQIEISGPPEHEMLEAYTTLGYLAAHTKHAQLVCWVSSAVYRVPGLLAKCVTTLDVLSQGRACLGIGASWNDAEAVGLGLPFPPLAERFERLEEAVQICLQMWSNSEEPFVGKHHQLARTLNSPQSLKRPHPPILIGGGGERKTLRLVAQYADICNLFPGPDLGHKLDVLRQHCADVGRNYDEIEKTVMAPLDIGADGEKATEVLDRLHGFAELGIQHVHTRFPLAHGVRQIDLFAEKIIPQAATL